MEPFDSHDQLKRDLEARQDYLDECRMLDEGCGCFDPPPIPPAGVGGGGGGLKPHVPAEDDPSPPRWTKAGRQIAGGVLTNLLSAVAEALLGL